MARPGGREGRPAYTLSKFSGLRHREIASS
jgi:hypothetical protein